jgi:hypothetical protein
MNRIVDCSSCNTRPASRTRNMPRDSVANSAGSARPVHWRERQSESRRRSASRRGKPPVCGRGLRRRNFPPDQYLEVEWDASAAFRLCRPPPRGLLPVHRAITYPLRMRPDKRTLPKRRGAIVQPILPVVRRILSARMLARRLREPAVARATFQTQLSERL